MRAPISVSLVLLVLAAAPAPAWAQTHRAAIATFSGRRARATQRRVRRAARSHFDLASRRRARSASRRAGIEGVDRVGARELAEDLDVDVIVQGQVAGRGRNASVTIVVRDDQGRELDRAELDVPRGRRARREFSAALEDMFSEVVGELDARAAPPEVEEDPPEVEVEDDPAPETPRDGPTDGLAVLSATIGVVGRTRDATVDLVGGGRRGYASGLYPELRAAIEVRPLANDPDAGRGLFLDASFAHSLGLGSQTDDTMAAVDSTNFVRFDLNAGFLIGVDVVELGPMFGFGYDGYHLAANTILPTAEYLYLRPGIRVRVRLLEDESLVLDVGGAYRAVLGRGAFSDAFGADGDTHGVDLGARIGGNLLAGEDVGFTWGAGVEYVGYFLSFAGAAADAPADSGVETHVRLRAELGWSFR